MIPLLRDTAAKIGPPPRRLELAVPRFSNASPHDPLAWALHDEPLLAEHGELVMGAVVWTLTAMFKVGDAPCAGVVVHPLPGAPQPPLHTMVELADTLFEARTTKDPALFHFARYLADDALPCAVPVPPRLAGGSALAITRIGLGRRMPGRRLAAPFLPLLIHGGARTVAVLPGEHWAESLRRTFAEWHVGE